MKIAIYVNDDKVATRVVEHDDPIFAYSLAHRALGEIAEDLAVPAPPLAAALVIGAEPTVDEAPAATPEASA